jgi:serine/threonine-protein kinase
LDKSEGTGERVGGYRVVRRLATAGTSDLLLATGEGPEGLERTVVLHRLLSHQKHGEEAKALFGQEAAAYARLSHRSIVRLYDVFAADDQLVMVLEYVEGPPLGLLRGMLKSVGQAFEDSTALYIGASIFDALAAAHTATDGSGMPAPLIHREVNPTNVLMAWDGEVKLSGFAVAKVSAAMKQSSASLLTGTYGYLAPEQVKREDVTPRADVYSAAIILWEMLTKRRAFLRGALPENEVLRALAEPRIVSIDVLRPDLDKNVRDAMRRALEPRAAKRNMTAEEMVATLRSAMPNDEGREKLVATLAMVRHEPKPASTSLPPPLERSDELETRKVASRPALPAQRPASSSTVAVASKPASGQHVAVPVVRKTASYGALAVGLKAPGTADASRPGNGGTPRSPIVAPAPAATPAQSAAELGPPSEEARAPLVSGLKSAMDEVLRDIPSSIPPPPPVPGAEPAPGNDAEQRRESDPNVRAIGYLPAAPPPLGGVAGPPPVASASTSVGAFVKAMPSSFPAMTRTLAMGARVDVRAPSSEGVAPADKAPARMQATTAPMPVVAPPVVAPPVVAAPEVAAPEVALKAAPSEPKVRTVVMGQSTGASPPARPLPDHVPTLRGVAPGPGSSGALEPGSRAPAVPPSRASAPANLSAAPAIEPAPAAPRRRAPVALALLGLALLAAAVVQLRRPAPAPPTSTSTSTAASTVPATSTSTAPAPVTPTPTPTVTAPATPTATVSSTSTSTPTSTPTVATDAPSIPASSASAQPAAAPAPAPTDLPPAAGRIKTTGAVAGRRIFVDGKTVGQTPESVVVKCGSHQIKLGSAGSPHAIDVPCGGEITVGDR